MTDAERRSRIGASLAPAVMGLSPYQNGTPLGAYLYLTEALDGLEPTEEMEWGTMMEDAILQHAAEHYSTGILAVDPKLHVEHKFMGASPDGVLLNGPRWCGFEMKNVTDAVRAKEWKEPGGDGVPDHVMIQVQQQIEVFGFEAVEVAACIFGRPPVYYHVPRSEEIIAHIIRANADMWKRKEERRPPEPDWTHPDTPRLVEMLHKPEEGKRVDLTAHTNHLVLEYERLGSAEREASAGRAEVRAHIIQALGDAQFGLLPDGRRIRRREVKALPPSMSKGRKSYYQLDILKGESNGGEAT